MLKARLLMLGYVLFSFVLAASGVAGQSLKERKIQQSDDQSLAREIAYTNQVCRSNIQASVDWQSFSTPDHASGADPVESCDAALGAIESLCADQPGQEAVRQHIDQVVCVRGPSRDVKLKKGTLFFQVESSPADNFEFVRDYLTGEMADDDSTD